MTREAIIQKTIEAINKSPEEKVVEIADFIDRVLKQYEDYTLLKKNEINSMSLAYAENSFRKGWDLEDEEENEYWDCLNLKQREENVLQKGIETLVQQSDTFHFLIDEEDIYSEDDLEK